MTCVASSVPVGTAGRFTGQTIIVGGVRWTVGLCLERTHYTLSTVEAYAVTTDARSFRDSDGRGRRVRPGMTADWCSDEAPGESWQITAPLTAADFWKAVGGLEKSRD